MNIFQKNLLFITILTLMTITPSVDARTNHTKNSSKEVIEKKIDARHTRYRGGYQYIGRYPIGHYYYERPYYYRDDFYNSYSNQRTLYAPYTSRSGTYLYFR